MKKEKHSFSLNKNKDREDFFRVFILFCLTGLKVQRSLKVKIEAQGRFLERFGQSSHSKTIIGKACKSFASSTTAPLPSLSEESESLESQTEKEHESVKKQRISEEGVFPTSFEHASSTPPEFYNQTWNVPWSQLAAACQSTLDPSFLF